MKSIWTCIADFRAETPRKLISWCMTSYQSRADCVTECYRRWKTKVGSAPVEPSELLHWSLTIAYCADRSFCTHPHLKISGFLHRQGSMFLITWPGLFDGLWCCYLDHQQKHCYSFRQLQAWSRHQIKYPTDLSMPSILSGECRVVKNKHGIKRQKEIIFFAAKCKMTINVALGVKVLWWTDTDGALQIAFATQAWKLNPESCFTPVPMRVKRKWEYCIAYRQFMEVSRPGNHCSVSCSSLDILQAQHLGTWPNYRGNSLVAGSSFMPQYLCAERSPLAVIYFRSSDSCLPVTWWMTFK